MSGLEVFDSRLAWRTTEPRLTITQRRSILLNRAAFRALGEPTHVVLLSDQEENRIGLRTAEPDNPNSYRIAPVSTSTYRIGCASFLRYCCAAESLTRRYLAAMDHDVLVVDLNSAGYPTRRATAVQPDSETDLKSSIPDRQ